MPHPYSPVRDPHLEVWRAKIIALVGKGGTGKTALSALMARQMIRAGLKRLLLIDADPAKGLAISLAAQSARTVGEIREEIIQQARRGDKEEKARLAGMIDYLLLEALQERGDYSLLVMGHMEAKGCYCPVNALLREAIDDLAENFDYIIIDGEAGIEQINREVIKRVDILAIVSDASRRGIHTARLIREISKRIEGMTPRRAGVIFNRVNHLGQDCEKEVLDAGLEVFGFIPEDPAIGEYDTRGRSLLELPEDSPAVKALRPILENLFSGEWRAGG